MTENYPYVSADYFTDDYRPQEMRLWAETITRQDSSHYANEPEFYYVLAGHGTLIVNTQPISLAAGDLIQLLPYHVHHFGRENRALQVIHVRASLGLLLLTATQQGRYRAALKNFEQQPPLVHLNPAQQAALTPLCQLALNAGNDAQSANLNVALISLLEHFLQIGKRAILPAPPTPYQALAYLQLHHQAPLTAATVGTALGCSGEAVEGMLQQVTGHDFATCLDQVRIRNATGLMQFPELTLRKIGMICGYRSPSTFYARFTAIHGMTPGAYRAGEKPGNDAQREDKQRQDKQRQDKQRQDKRAGGEQATEMLSVNDGWTIGAYLVEHCCDPLTLPALAAHFHQSDERVAQLLQATFNASFPQLKHHLRVQLAASLLTAMPTLSIAQVAQKVGYGDVTTFIRQFKRALGVTPGAWRKEERQAPRA
ncbi:helix-turn-helix transcriptional regulator [Lacticaseibacillus mingshuiensis]|uniref:Helix-turn-helix domain-containing protein n=1 Tax=Lacticaseibacillus mingshuiensis TaxID=2799574 RepID=A0ABW4CI56_9LACO|nr:AraC family transcriptional regulator [Lacticaseibacillus mingshuiensis]